MPKASATSPHDGEGTQRGATDRTRNYWSTWTSEPWSCGCGWAGRCEGRSTSQEPFPIVFSCPQCLAQVGEVAEPFESERAQAVVSSPPLPFDQMDVWLDKLKNEAWPGRRRFPSGTESTVSVLPDDWFFGVDKSWLVERLRLDPESSPLDLGDRGGFVVYLDDDMIDIPDELASQDFEDLLGPGQTNGELVTYGDGGIIGGRFDVTGGWIHDSSPEIRNRYIWVGADANLSELALTCLSEVMEYWEPKNH